MVSHSGKSARAVKRLSHHLIFCLHDGKITETGAAMQAQALAVDQSGGTGGLSDANSSGVMHAVIPTA